MNYPKHEDEDRYFECLIENQNNITKMLDTIKSPVSNEWSKNYNNDYSF